MFASMDLNFPMVIFDFSIYNVIPVIFVGAVLIDGSCSDTSQCQTTNAQCLAAGQARGMTCQCSSGYIQDSGSCIVDGKKYLNDTINFVSH